MKLTLTCMVLLGSSLAFAQNTSTYTETQNGGNQGVIFQDDVLAAPGFGPNDVRIMVMPTPKRVTLIRPRTQFVTEMLKSVESL